MKRRPKLGSKASAEPKKSKQGDPPNSLFTKIKERITIIIAVISTITSVVSLYYNNVFKLNRLYASVNISDIQPLIRSHNASGINFSENVTLYNSGNTHIAIQNIYTLVKILDDVPRPVTNCENQRLDFMIVMAGDIGSFEPYVIKPGEVNTRKITLTAAKSPKDTEAKIKTLLASRMPIRGCVIFGLQAESPSLGVTESHKDVAVFDINPDGTRNYSNSGNLYYGIGSTRIIDAWALF